MDPQVTRVQQVLQGSPVTQDPEDLTVPQDKMDKRGPQEGPVIQGPQGVQVSLVNQDHKVTVDPLEQLDKPDQTVQVVSPVQLDQQDPLDQPDKRESKGPRVHQAFRVSKALRVYPESQDSRGREVTPEIGVLAVHRDYRAPRVDPDQQDRADH